MHRPRPRHTAARLAGGFALALSFTSLGACSGDPEPSAEDPSPAATTTAGEESTPTEDAVVPAGGPLIEAKQFRVHAPQGFKRTPGTSTIVEAVYSPEPPGGQITVGHLPNIGSSSLASVAKTYRDDRNPTLSRADDAELGGDPAVHMVGENGFQHADVYALVRDGQAIEIRFLLAPGKAEEAAREKLIASVLASWEWR